MSAGEPLALSPDEMGAVTRRLRRAQGQIAGIVKMLEEGRDCREVVVQIAAASHALDRAGFAVIASGLRRCLEDPDPSDAAELERLFLTLA